MTQFSYLSHWLKGPSSATISTQFTLHTCTNDKRQNSRQKSGTRELRRSTSCCLGKRISQSCRSEKYFQRLPTIPRAGSICSLFAILDWVVLIIRLCFNLNHKFALIIRLCFNLNHNKCCSTDSNLNIFLPFQTDNTTQKYNN